MPALRNIDVREVSLVDKPAIRKRFLLFKSREGEAAMPKFSDSGLAALTERINAPDPQEDVILTKVAEIRKAASQPFGDAERDVALALLRVAGTTEQPVEKRAEVVAQLMGAPAQDDLTKAEMTCPKCGAKVKMEKSAAAKFCGQCGAEYVQKAAAPTPGIDELLKADTPLSKAVADILKAKDGQIETLAKRVDTLEGDKTRAQAIAKAESTGLPIDRMKLASLIEKSEAGGFGEELISTLKAAGEQIKASVLFGEIGSPGSLDPASASARIAKLASDMIAKSATPLTKEQAEVAVMEQNPALYTEYLAEKGGR